MSDVKIKKLCFSGLMAALCFAGYVFFPAINAFGLKIHLGNSFVVVSALLLGGLYGGLAGAIGLSLADILSGWASSAPITFVCKLNIALITGLVAHKIAKISNEEHEKKYTLIWSAASAAAGLACNCIMDPILNYWWQKFMFPNAEEVLKVNMIFTSINAVINTVAAVIIYNAIRPWYLKNMKN